MCTMSSYSWVSPEIKVIDLLAVVGILSVASILLEVVRTAFQANFVTPAWNSYRVLIGE